MSQAGLLASGSSLATPSRPLRISPRSCRWHSMVRSPITVTGSRWTFTSFPILRWPFFMSVARHLGRIWFGDSLP